MRHLHLEGLPLLTDGALASYRAAGLKRSIVATLLHPSTWRRGVKALRAHRQRKTAGDPWQQGGAMMVRSDGAVTWTFRSKASGDHPSLETLRAEARNAVA